MRSATRRPTSRTTKQSKTSQRQESSLRIKCQAMSICSIKENVTVPWLAAACTLEAIAMREVRRSWCPMVEIWATSRRQLQISVTMKSLKLMCLRTVAKPNLRKLSAMASSNIRHQRDLCMTGATVGLSLQTTFWHAKMTAGWNTAKDLNKLCPTRLS